MGSQINTNVGFIIVASACALWRDVSIHVLVYMNEETLVEIFELFLHTHTGRFSALPEHLLSSSIHKYVVYAYNIHIYTMFYALK